jgi:hypothetical protein
MAGKDLPITSGPLVQGLGYESFPVPTNDGCSLKGTDQDEVMGAPASMPAPLEAVSLATKTVDAPALGAFQLTNLHDTNWLDPTKPHMSPESQKG